MIDLIRIETYKIFSKWRTYIAFITIFGLVGLVEVAMLFEGENYFQHITSNLRDSFLFVGNFLNGYLISHLVLNALGVHIPFLIALVAGDLLAGEATGGTYRMLLTRPVSRMKLLLAKFAAGAIYTNALIAFLAVMSLGLGIILFGTGELIVLSNKVIIFAADDILWRFAFAYGYAALGMTVVMALAFLFSSLVENSIGPIVATMAVIIVFIIISALDVGLLREMRPYLFTSYIGSWRTVFNDPFGVEQFVKDGLVLLGHIIGFYTVTAVIFRRKDILS